MTIPTDTAEVAKIIIERADRVENKRQDIISKAARGVLGFERRFANYLLERKANKIDYPPPLENLIRNQREFFTRLNSLESAILESYGRQNPYISPEQLPKLNMCGYTSNSITQALREKGLLDSRVVYGHHSDGESVRYHYWTEVSIGDTPYTIDATYKQFNPNVGDKILIYPTSHISNYGLTEFKKGDTPVIGEHDEGTIDTLTANNGLLPLDDYMRDAYQDDGGKIISTFSQLKTSLLGEN